MDAQFGMDRFYQGQLDFFCVVYAVINALTAVFGLNLSQARALLASALYDVSCHPQLWQATLENKTDFYWLAEYLLASCRRGSRYPLFVYRPFAPAGQETVRESALDLSAALLYRPEELKQPGAGPKAEAALWSALEEWLPTLQVPPAPGTARRVALLRFHRHVPYMKTPIVSHWTAADRMGADVLHLRDASREDSALHVLVREQTVLHPDETSAEQNVVLEPESLFFLERL